MSTKKQILILLAIVAVAFLIRLPILFNRGGFWLDEVFTKEFAQISIPQSLHYLVWENNPPLYYWLAHGWGAIFGFSEAALRFLSLIINLAVIILVYLLAVKILRNKITGFFAALITALAFFQIFFSTEARMYQLLLLFSLSSLYFFYSYETTEKKKFLWWCTLFSLGAYYTHLTAAYVFIIENLFFFYYWRQTKKPSVKLWLVAQLAGLALFLPWLIVFFVTKLSTFTSQAWYLYSEYPGFYFWFQTKQFLYFVGSQNFIELIFFIVFIAALISFIFKIDWLNNKIFLQQHLTLTVETQQCCVSTGGKILILLIYLVPITIGFVFNFSISKYFILASIGLYLIIAHFLAAIFDYLKSKGKKVVFLIFFLVLFLPQTLDNIQVSLYNWPIIFDYIEQVEKPGDAVILIPNVNWLFGKNYYHGSSPLLLAPSFREKDWLLEAVKTNWNVAVKKEDLTGLNEQAREFKRVFLIAGRKDTNLKDDFIFLWFLEHGWRLEETFFPPGLYDNRVVLLERQ